MSARGRKPKPRPIEGGGGGAPEKPATIADDPVASALWDSLVAEMTESRILAKTDGPILACLCSAYSRFVKAREILSKEGWVVVNGKNGSTRSHPLLNIEATAATEMSRYASELGLSPTARARIQHVESAEREKTLDELLA